MKNNIEWKKYKYLQVLKPKLFEKYENLEIIFDENIVNDFEKNNGVKIGVVYESKYNYLVVDLVKSLNKLFAYERIIPVQEGAVVTIPYIEGKFILLKQYRHANRSIEYAFPRGFGEHNIVSKLNAVKELEEEVGTTPLKVVEVGRLTPDSGLSSNIVEVFLCEINNFEIDKHHEGIEDIILLTKDEIKTWISTGKITDSFTISAFFLYTIKF